MAIKEIYKKAKKLVKENRIRLDFQTSKRIYFTVYSREVHSVIYEKDNRKFVCDCKYFSVKSRECSHIIACKIYMGMIK